MPDLGRGVQSSSGETPIELFSAFYFAGGSMTTVGSGDLRSVSRVFKFLTVIDSVIGMLVLTMTVTYVIQSYTALQSRNSLAPGRHHTSACTGDPSLLLAGMGPDDDFTHGETHLTDLSTAVTASYESHRFYSVLIYSRFPPPYYALARSALVTMQLVTLVGTALADEPHRWLKRSASVTQLRRRIASRASTTRRHLSAA